MCSPKEQILKNEPQKGQELLVPTNQIPANILGTTYFHSGTFSICFLGFQIARFLNFHIPRLMADLSSIACGLPHWPTHTQCRTHQSHAPLHMHHTVCTAGNPRSVQPLATPALTPCNSFSLPFRLRALSPFPVSPLPSPTIPHRAQLIARASIAS